ncbi:hypothetical protein GMORB2_7038 [Geosmithia morbida]|uniref:Uncharacterized protein n=1 Tax=Geosmithia morbida TaxID=1094350 RepID=A0A9P5D3P4_9HYPO|nr:uncharacterized protein GMORB2_7038 [Geosmithia morbida]KAF4122731.1 hypothetical protein GMORB2_7038 [Geosmithia morbida]
MRGIRSVLQYYRQQSRARAEQSKAKQNMMKSITIPFTEEEILNTIWFLIIGLEVILIIGISIQSMIRRVRSKAASYDYGYSSYPRYYSASYRGVMPSPVLPLEEKKRLYLEATSRRGCMIP